MKPRHKRLIAIAAGVVALGVAAALVLSAFQQNLVFFFTPSQIAAAGRRSRGLCSRATHCLSVTLGDRTSTPRVIRCRLHGCSSRR